MSDLNNILSFLKSQANAENVRGMARFGINPDQTLGISMPVIRNLAKYYRKQHDLALELWESGIHEAKILAGLVDNPALLTGEQMEKWVLDFDSWDVCDQVCMNLFRKSPLGWEKAYEWHDREEEFVKRAAFVLMATLVMDKKAEDEKFLPFFELMLKECGDNRNMVKKAINWALRQIGKRNLHLNEISINWCNKIRDTHSPSARWIASDALRELTNPKTLERLLARGRKA